MGRGLGEQHASTATPRRSGSRSVEKACRQLQEDFGPIGYRQPRDMSDGIERDIADPNRDYVNKFVDGRPDPVRPYTSLFRYCPAMKGNRGHWPEVNIRFDHISGDLFVVGEVTRPAGLTSSVCVVKVENAGKSVDDAIKAAQQMYDETFAAFKASKAGKHASYSKPSKYNHSEPLQVMEHKRLPFEDAEPDIVAHLATVGMPAQKAYREHAALMARDYEAMEQSKREGYAEVRAQGYVD